MHKKLLALLATLTLLLSAFPANVFAVRQSDLSLILSANKVISSAPSTDYQLINGTVPIIRATDTSYKIRVAGQQAGIIYDQLTTNGNNFYFYLPTNLPPQDVIVTAFSGGDAVATATIQVRYNVITNPSQLQFDYSGEQNPTIISGKVTNSKGEPVVGKSVLLVGVGADGNASGTSYFTGVTTNSKGEFGSAVLQWQTAEKLELRLGSDTVNSTTHLQGEVAPKKATLKVTPNKAVRTVTQTSFEVTGSGFAAEVKNVSFTLLKDSQQVADHATLPLPQHVQTDGTGNFTTAFNWTPQQAGTYTLVASTGNHVAATTIVVTNPTSYNLINSAKLEELKVGLSEFTIGSSGVHLVHFLTSANFTNEFVYTVYIDGQLTQDTISGQEFTKLATGKITMSATGLGTKVIKIVAHKLADKYSPGAKPAFERTITAKIDGWDATLSPAQLTVNEAQEITLVIKDKSGKAINNARVEIEGYGTYLPGTANVQAGTYSFADVKFADVGQKAIRAYQGAQLMAELELDVVGQQVYKVKPDVTTLLQGKGEDVQLTVTHSGTPVLPSLVRWFYADGSSGTAYPTHLGEGVCTVNINAAQPGPLTLLVENFDGTLCGEASLQVVAPKLELVDAITANLTNNFKTRARFRVIDPRDGGILTGNLEIVPLHLSTVEILDASGGLLGDTIQGAAEHVLTILPRATTSDWTSAELVGEATAVAFKLNGALIDGNLPVREATLASNPETILIGAQNNLTFTYSDANAKPISAKEVVVNGRPLGKTDTKGQISYPVGVATAATEVEAATDVPGAKVGLSIKLAFDQEAPRLTYSVTDNKASFTITDDIRITRIKINGQETDFWPSPSYQFDQTLQSGVNTVRIKAQDSNDNTLDEVIEITYTPKPEPVILRGNQVIRNGDLLYVQARQLEELGARFTWQAAPGVATFVLGRNRVEVIVGSLTGRVNGTAVAMPATPFLAENRVYIPLRFVIETLGLKMHWAPGDVITILP